MELITNFLEEASKGCRQGDLCPGLTLLVLWPCNSSITVGFRAKCGFWERVQEWHNPQAAPMGLWAAGSDGRDWVTGAWWPWLLCEPSSC